MNGRTVHSIHPLATPPPSPPPMATPPPPPVLPPPVLPPPPGAAAPSIHLHPPRFPQILPVKLEPAPTTPLPPTLPQPHPQPSPSLTITIPSCSRWFSFDAIHDTERRILPEFFDGKSPSRNPDAYKYYRDSIIRQFRANPLQKLTFTEARRRLIGDIGSVRRVFDFLEGWGLINYVPLAKPLVSREGEEGIERKERTQRLCGSCKSPCSLACFVTDKADFILCTRCYVRGNYRPGLSSSDFKRFDISEETKTEWTDKETLHLLEAVLQYGEDWKRVAEHVGSRSEKECVARFVKLPFGEQFLRPEGGRADSRQYQRNDQASAENGETNVEDECDSKRRRLTPLADASNPIMAQVAFLSAMVGSEVVKSASQAAIAALHDVDPGNVSGANGLINEAVEGENSGENDVESLEEVFEQAQSQHKTEQREVEQSISDIIEVQMKEIQEKIVHFEATELELEKERLELCYMKDLLFADQLSLLQHKARLKLFEGRDGEKTRTTNAVI